MDALEMDPATTKEVRQYADLVIHRFQILTDRLRDARLDEGDSRGSSLADDFSEASTDSVDSDQESYVSQRGLKTKSDAWTQLKATLLPLLRDLVTKMQLCLDPTCLSENPVPTLQLILDIQPQLEDTLLQIKHAVRVLCPGTKKTDSSQSDQHLQEFKQSRLFPLKTALRSRLCCQTIRLIQESQRSIVGLGLSYPYARSPHVWMLERTSTALEVIDFAIVCLKISEFDLVRRDWPKQIRGMDDIMTKCLEWTHKSPVTGFDEPFIEVAQSLLPIIKLSRLFFNKLSTYGKQSLPFFTEMHSDQLKSIQNLPCRILGALEKFIKHLGLASAPEPFCPRHLLAKTTKLLKASFEPSLVIISHHFILLVPEADGSAGQNSFKNWYVTWYNHFNLAIQNLKNAI